MKKYTLINLLLFLYVLLSIRIQAQHFCGTEDSIISIRSSYACGLLNDYIPDESTNFANSPIYTIKLKYHIMQKSVIDPANFINNQTSIDWFINQKDRINNIYSNIELPTIPVIPQNEEISDSRIRFSLNESDVLFHVDSVGWDRFGYAHSTFYPIVAVGPLNMTTFKQDIVVSGQIAIWQLKNNYEVVINNGGIQDDYFEHPANTYLSYNGTFNQTTITIENPNNINITGTELRYTSQDYRNCTSDNYNNYGINDPGYLHIFITGGSDPNYQVGSGCGPSSNWLNMSYVSPDSPWGAAPLTAHEIGHCFGLFHTNNPQFTDLPSNDQFCWCTCNNSTTSNNIMGYNTCRRYLSPLQIATMRRNISSDNGGLLQKTLNCLTNEGALIEVNQNTTWSINHALRGDLIVTNNSMLTITCRVNMPPQAKIIIEPGSRLIVDGGIITNQCGFLWQGIYVEGNRNLHQTPANQGVVDLKNGATIEYAREAISVFGLKPTGDVDWNKTGGIVHIFGTTTNRVTFKNCRRGISFLSYENINPNSGLELKNQSFINYAQFQTTEQLPQNVIPYAGISLHAINGIKIKGCTFENTRIDITTVPIDERGNGIISIDANYRVTSSYSFSTGQPVLGTENTFTNLKYGVLTSGGTTRSDVDINDNIFNNCVYGVALNGANYGEIARNNFDINGEVPFINGGFGFGIYANSGWGFIAEDNNFTTATPIGTVLNQGVHVNNSGGVAAGKVRNNTISNVYIGTQTTNSNDNLIIDCNTYDKQAYSTVDFNHNSGFLQDQGGNTSFNPPNNNGFTGLTCNSTNLAQVYKSGPAASFIYTAKDNDPLSINQTCHNLGGFMLFSSLDNQCITSPEVELGTGITVAPVITILKGKLGTVKTELVAKRNLLATGDAPSLITAINTQSAGALKNTLQQSSPLLSDRVMLAYLNKAAAPPAGHIKKIIIDNSPVTQEVLTKVSMVLTGDTLAIKSAQVNGGITLLENEFSKGDDDDDDDEDDDDDDDIAEIMEDIMEAQVGVSDRRMLEGEIGVLNAQRLATMDAVVRTYLDTNWVDSVTIFLEQEGSLEALCALVPLNVKKDTIRAKQHIATIRQVGNNILAQKPTSPKGLDLISFCDFHQLLMKVYNRPAGYFGLTTTEIGQLTTVAQSNASVAANAQAVLDFINERTPTLIGFDIFFPKSMTIEEANQIVETEKEKIQFLAIPNPTNGKVTFQLQQRDIDFASNNYEIVITDMQGKLVKILPVNNVSISYEFLKQQHGVYLIHLVKNKQRVQTQKLILVE